MPNPVARTALVALQHFAITVIVLTGIVSLFLKDFDVQPWFYAKVILFLVLVSSLGKAYKKMIRFCWYSVGLAYLLLWFH